jgi:glycogen operon protein
MSEKPYNLPLPDIVGRNWHRAIDTSQDTPADILLPHLQPSVNTQYRVHPRSVVVLESR